MPLQTGGFEDRLKRFQCDFVLCFAAQKREGSWKREKKGEEKTFRCEEEACEGETKENEGEKGRGSKKVEEGGRGAGLIPRSSISTHSPASSLEMTVRKSSYA
jgi:hypothetical protein